MFCKKQIGKNVTKILKNVRKGATIAASKIAGLTLYFHNPSQRLLPK